MSEATAGREPLRGEITARVAVANVTYWVDKPYTYAVPERLAGRVLPGVRVAVPFGGSRPREGIVLALGGAAEKPLKPVLEVLDDEPLLTPERLQMALWMRERFFCTVMEAVRAILPAGLWYRVSPVYCLAEGVDEAAARRAAGSSAARRLLVDAVIGHGGRCELSDIEALFGKKNPGPALAELVRLGIFTADAEAVRRAGDKTIRRAALAVTPEQAVEYAEKNRRAVRQGAVLRALAQLRTAAVADLCYFTGAGRETVQALERKGLVTVTRQEVYRRPFEAPGSLRPLPVLSPDQRRVFEGIREMVLSGSPGAALLFGVTGSGKTTIYVRLIDEVLRRGRSAILLVPEISLTPQMLRTFSEHFGDTVAVLHSALSLGERYDEWKRIRAGAARLVIGTRSAVFAPVSEPGIIIIDEEQEDTYKSETGARYHARDVAKYLCAQAGCTLVLGSATPDVRSRYYADTGRYRLFTLPGRYNRQSLPRVTVADMRREYARGNRGSISLPLREEIAENLSRGEQTILFLNRRGASKLVSCAACGYVYACPNCSANLTYHSVGGRLVCHYCGFTRPPGRVCPECGGKLLFTGAGTQKVVEELEALFPGTEILRMDTDSVAPVGSHRALFEQFSVRRIPILVGTQMITKGLNFENVTLVGVLSADQSLYGGDYRAGERTFSLITQVVGRSGRFEKPGRAVVQTFTPDNEVIRQAAVQDYSGFYESEIALRRLTGAPPFSERYTLTASGEDEDAVLRCCGAAGELMRRRLAEVPGARVLGPAPLPVARIGGVWRYRITVQCPEKAPVRPAIRQTLMDLNGSRDHRGTALYADYDPTD